MQSQIDAICNLLKGGNYDFIRSLLEISFISKDVLFEAIKQCCDRIEYMPEIPAIVSLINDHFEFDDLNLLDYLFTIFARQLNSAKENVDLFKRMIDMGATIIRIDNSQITSMHPDIFFYYAERHDTDINLYMRSVVYNRFQGYVQVHGWIIEHWMLADIEYDLPWFCKIARVAHDMQRYFAQVMTKLSEKIDLHIILLSIWDVRIDEKEDLLVYVPDCKHSEELLLFRSLMLIGRGWQLDGETRRLKSLIEENDIAQKIANDIYRKRVSDITIRYEHMIPSLTQLVNMMKIDN